MRVSGDFPQFGRVIFNTDITVYSPASGFEVSIMETGLCHDGVFTGVNLINF